MIGSDETDAEGGGKMNAGVLVSINVACQKGLRESGTRGMGGSVLGLPE
jgi:hypothetical protein